MSNFGFERLRLVNPYQLAYQEARSAVHSQGILRAAEEYLTLAEAVAAGPVDGVYLIGQAADAIAQALDEAGVPFQRSGTLEIAVRSAAAAARPGDVVLISPACASFDQFRDYADRGEQFARIAREAARGL